MERLKTIKAKIQLRHLFHQFGCLNFHPERICMTKHERDFLNLKYLTCSLRMPTTVGTAPTLKILHKTFEQIKSNATKHLLIKAFRAPGSKILCLKIATCLATVFTVPGKKQFSFIQLAKCQESTELESFLKKSKINDVNSRHSLGWTALHAAAANGETEIVKILIRMGADVNAGDNFSDIYTKARENAVDPVSIMICRQYEFSTNTNTCMTFTGFTALHYAVLNNNAETVELLLQAGADPMVVNSSGHQPIKYAQSEEIKNLLFTCIADCKKLEELKKIKERQRFPLEERLKLHIIGQEMAVNNVVATMRRKENGWTNDKHPIVFLFLGCSGTGKTELAKQLANYLHKNENEAFIRIDMSEYQERHDAAKLIGSPPGYVGYEDGGRLTERLRKYPNAVVLFDEIDKAHPDVLNILLQLFDEGRLTDGKGETMNCKEAVFILTSNLAADEIARKAREAQYEESFLDEKKIKTRQGFPVKDIQQVLQQHFGRDEFMGRINEVVCFLPFTKSELNKLVVKELEFWVQKAFKEHKIKLEWTKEVEGFIADSYNPHFGVRSIKYEIERSIINHIAEAHGRDLITQGSKVKIIINYSSDRDEHLMPKIELEIETK